MWTDAAQKPGKDTEHQRTVNCKPEPNLPVEAEAAAAQRRGVQRLDL